MAPGKLFRPAGPALSPPETTMTVLSDLSHSNPYIPSTFTDNLPLPRIMVFDLDYTLWPFWCDTHISPPVKVVKDSASSRKADGPRGKGQSFVANKMSDRWGEYFGFYSEVPAVLSAASDCGVILGVASRTHTPDIARDLLKGLTVPVYPSTAPTSSNSKETPSSGKETPSSFSSFSSSSTTTETSHKKANPRSASLRIVRAVDLFPAPLQQIYPGTKTTHFRRIHEATSTPKLQSQIPGLIQGSPPVEFRDMLFFDDEARNRNVETELGVTFWLVRDGVSKAEIDKGVWEWRKRNGIGKPQGNE